METWKVLEEYPYYAISNHGNFKNINTGKIRKSMLVNGYACHYIRHNKKVVCLRVHRLVAENFLDEPEQYILEWAASIKRGVPFVNHIDGNKENNHIDNLEWCTGSENARHAIDNGQSTGKNGKVTKSITEEEVAEIRRMFKPYDPEYGARALGRKYGVTGGYISNICNGTSRK